jgi:hypothetical protein
MHVMKCQWQKTKLPIFCSKTTSKLRRKVNVPTLWQILSLNAFSKVRLRYILCICQLLNLECKFFALDDMNQGCQIIFSSRKSHLGKFWKVLQLKIFYDQFVYIKVKWYSLHMSIWYILWSFGIFFPVWYTYCTAKNLATLIWMTKEEQSTILWLLHCIQIARFFLLQNI